MNITVELTNKELHDAILAFVEDKMKVRAEGGVSIVGINEREVTDGAYDYTATVRVDIEPF